MSTYSSFLLEAKEIGTLHVTELFFRSGRKRIDPLKIENLAARRRVGENKYNPGHTIMMQEIHKN